MDRLHWKWHQLSLEMAATVIGNGIYSHWKRHRLSLETASTHWKRHRLSLVTTSSRWKRHRLSLETASSLIGNGIDSLETASTLIGNGIDSHWKWHGLSFEMASTVVYAIKRLRNGNWRKCSRNNGSSCPQARPVSPEPVAVVSIFHVGLPEW